MAGVPAVTDRQRLLVDSVRRALEIDCRLECETRDSGVSNVCKSAGGSECRHEQQYREDVFHAIPPLTSYATRFRLALGHFFSAGRDGEVGVQDHAVAALALCR